MRRMEHVGAVLLVWALFTGSLTALFAQPTYPTLYGTIGDRIFEAASGYAALAEHPFFEAEAPQLREFVEQAEEARIAGLKLEQERSDRAGRLAYVSKLRWLEDRQRGLDRSVIGAIDRLGSASNFTVLEALKENPYRVIRQRVQSYLIAPVIENGDLPPVDLKRSLEVLKQRLLEARMSKMPMERCLNDVTAINYWMLDTERARYRQAWCQARDAAKQTGVFEAAARESCSQESPLYEEWRKRSLPYRTTLLLEFTEQCR